MDLKLQKVAERAYHKFVIRGGEHGHDLADWLEAEKEIEAEEKAKKKIKPVSRKATKSTATKKKIIKNKK